jgi:hypothetical protein
VGVDEDVIVGESQLGNKLVDLLAILAGPKNKHLNKSTNIFEV